MGDQRNFYLFVGGLFVFLGLCFTFFQLRPEKPVSDSNSLTFKQVDRLRKNVEQKKRLEQDRALVDNYKSAPALSVHYRPIQNVDADDGKLKLQSSQNHAAIDSGDSSNGMAHSLDNQINNFLVSKQKYEQLSRIERQKYVADFKKEALAMGYHVELNDKLEVVRFDRAPSSAAKPPVRIPPPPPPTSGVDSQESYDEE